MDHSHYSNTTALNITIHRERYYSLLLCTSGSILIAWDVWSLLDNGSVPPLICIICIQLILGDLWAELRHRPMRDGYIPDNEIFSGEQSCEYAVTVRRFGDFPGLRHQRLVLLIIGAETISETSVHGWFTAVVKTSHCVIPDNLKFYSPIYLSLALLLSIIASH
jgi:hypothetical protein